MHAIPIFLAASLLSGTPNPRALEREAFLAEVRAKLASGDASLARSRATARRTLELLADGEARAAQEYAQMKAQVAALEAENARLAKENADLKERLKKAEAAKPAPAAPAKP